MSARTCVRYRSRCRMRHCAGGSPRTTRARRSLPGIDLRALLHELHRLHFHPLRERLRFRDAVLRGEVAHVLRDLHRAEVRPAHRAEVRELRAFLRERLVVELARLVGIESEVELVFPAELEA